MTDLTADLADLINRRSAENDSNTPDIVLARFLTDTLAAFGTAVRERDRLTSDAYTRGWNDCAAIISAALMAPFRVAKGAGDGDPEYRFVTLDGRETEFDLHNEGPCGCRRETRDWYATPWRPAGLSSIIDGISAAGAEASATFDLTIDEVRALTADRDGWQARAEGLAHELAEQRADRVAFTAERRRLLAWLDELGYDAIAVDARLGRSDGHVQEPEFFELTAEEFEEGKRLSLERLGLTYAELQAMARDRGGNFTSAAAHSLWVAIGDTGAPRARTEEAMPDTNTELLESAARIREAAATAANDRPDDRLCCWDLERIGGHERVIQVREHPDGTERETIAVPTEAGIAGHIAAWDPPRALAVAHLLALCADPGLGVPSAVHKAALEVARRTHDG